MKCFILICVLQVLQGLEAASNCVEDMDEWLGMFNVKLRHMREDIESVRTCALQVESTFCQCTIDFAVVIAVFVGILSHSFDLIS